MWYEKNENNKVMVVGYIRDQFEYNHTAYKEKFYSSTLGVRRESGVVDFIPIIVSERLIGLSDNLTGEYVSIVGQFRSRNICENGKHRLALNVFARELSVEDILPFSTRKNRIFLAGYICKPPTYRITPFGREITDFILAVNRPYGKSDYIPCIAWCRNAKFIANLGVGTKIKVEGRLQSREYIKRLPGEEPEEEIRIAYEVSITNLSVGD